MSRFQDIILPSGEVLTHFAQLTDGEEYDGVLLDHLRQRKMRTQVNNDRIFEVESGEALWFELKRKNSNVHLYNNLKLFLGKDCTAEYDAIAHIRHETIPCVAVLMEAKDSVHPSDIKELITKTETLSKYITTKQAFAKATTGSNAHEVQPFDFAHLYNVKTLIPCLAGKSFPQALIAQCHEKHIMTLHPSGARYILKASAKVLRLLK